MVSYCVNSRWVYDIWMLRLGGRIGVDLRKMMSRFVFIIVVVVVIIYMIYIINLPRGSDLSVWLPSSFMFFAIYQWINAALILCALGCYSKAILAMS